MTCLHLGLVAPAFAALCFSIVRTSDTVWNDPCIPNGTRHHKTDSETSNPNQKGKWLRPNDKLRTRNLNLKRKKEIAKMLCILRGKLLPNLSSYKNCIRQHVACWIEIIWSIVDEGVPTGSEASLLNCKGADADRSDLSHKFVYGTPRQHPSPGKWAGRLTSAGVESGRWARLQTLSGTSKCYDQTEWHPALGQFQCLESIGGRPGKFYASTSRR